MLTLGQTPSIPVVSKVPTIILGMGALFGFPEQSDVPSIAAMVSSRQWPLIFSYGASGLSDKVDDGIMKEALLDFYTSSEKKKPDQIIIFRERGSPDNVLHGTVIDNKVCHPKNNDFYLGTHAGMIGITRQTYYHVLLDQAGFSADDLQEFVHSLSYMYQRSTTFIFVVPPICYAHLAASQLGAIYED
ncbi:Protein argonaute 4 -like protein [Gossypium arboreum]|uniref:Protein argonaute 4-like protein n=1 Tax=Gossypium arboreum TaxID=29729 RepID=A0A0B0PJ09_GOSAR|nr:Protein argonaute 4 -like protein [Gossypium arboreum]